MPFGIVVDLNNSFPIAAMLKVLQGLFSFQLGFQIVKLVFGNATNFTCPSKAIILFF